MATFELNQDYPLPQILDESLGSWIVEGLIKEVSSSEALILLRASGKDRIEIDFISSEECLVRFYSVKAPCERESVSQKIGSLTTLWVLAATEEVGTPIRLVLRPISYSLDPLGRFTLSIPMEPPLTLDEWRQLGMTYVAEVTINEGERRHICSDDDVEQLCEYLRKIRSFCIHAVRFEGDDLDMSVDVNGALVSYGHIKRDVKLISMSPDRRAKDIVRMKIDALPYLDLETERRHLISPERALGILRSFLSKGKITDLVPWPVDD